MNATLTSSSHANAPTEMTAIETSGPATNRVVLMRPLLLVAIGLFYASCVFDPADLLFHLKIPLFCVCWLIFSLWYLPKADRNRIPMGLILYACAMIGIPVFSVVYYLATNGSQPYEGFALLKSYLMISFSLLLFLSKIDALKTICRILSLLALATLTTFALMETAPGLFARVDAFLNFYGIANVNTRDYGDEVSLLLVFFVTSPMLVQIGRAHV